MLAAWLASEAPEPFGGQCVTDIWQHITGWEVVTAVVVIVAGWAVTTVARLHYIAKVAALGLPADARAPTRTGQRGGSEGEA